MRDAAPWVERAARVGYASKGSVYILVGLLATEAAFGTGGEKTGWSGAVKEIASKPFGEILLVIIAIGLLGYVTWRILAAVLDTENKGTAPKGLAARAYYLGTAVVHASLAAGVVAVLRGAHKSGGDEKTAHATATAMDKPFGRWIVVAAGLVVIGYAVYQIVKAWKSKLGDTLELSRVEPAARRWLVGISRFGIAARGIVFGVIGFFLVRAGLRHDPGEARGVGGALSVFDSHHWVLAAIAVGLAAYGVYMLVEAKYRRIRTT